MIKYVKGDLLRDAKNYDIIIHGCNCFHTMGAGIAAGVRKLYPEAYEADKKTPYGLKSKVGKFSFHRYLEFMIINAYTQYGYNINENGMDSTESKTFREEAIKKVFEELKINFGGQNKVFAFPLIGAGLADGNWENISRIIENALPNEQLVCVIYEKDNDNLTKFNL